MSAAFVCLAMATGLSAIATPLVRRFALRRELFDHVGSSRKIHAEPIPRLGGVAIVSSFYCSLACVLVWLLNTGASPRADRPGSLWILAGGLVIALLGVYDDVRGADAKTKFIVQFGVAIALYATGFRIDRISTPIGSFWMGPLSLPFTLLWIVGVTNAVNLIDGLDGLAGGIAVIALAAIFAISAMRHETFMMLVAASLGGSILGFLVYNFNPASIFMGDSGSMFLGFMIATSSIRASQKASTAIAILVPVIVLAIPLADTALAIVRRAIRRRGLFTGDREHIHHRLIDSGLSHRRAVLGLYVVSVTCGLAAVTLFMTQERNAIVAVCLTLSLITYLLLRRLRESAARDSTARRFTPVRSVIFVDSRHSNTSDGNLSDSEIAAKLSGTRAARLRRRV